MAFGKTLMLDIYDCNPKSMNDMGLHYDYLEMLVEVLGMTKMAGPFVCRAPATFIKKMSLDYQLIREEKFPDKAGISGWVGLVESGIQIHSLVPSRFSSIDIYTCGNLDSEMQGKVVGLTRSFFHFKQYETNFVTRGINV